MPDEPEAIWGRPIILVTSDDPIQLVADDGLIRQDVYLAWEDGRLIVREVEGQVE